MLVCVRPSPHCPQHKYVHTSGAPSAPGVTPASTPVQVGQAAIVTGFLISALVTPMEGVKSRLQIQYNANLQGTVAAGAAATTVYRGPIDCARQVISKLGVANGLYRYDTTTSHARFPVRCLLCNSLHAGACADCDALCAAAVCVSVCSGWSAVALCRMSNWSYFGTYEYFKQQLMARSPPAKPGAPAKLSMGYAVLAGGGAGICYWLSCYPMDVIKARLLGAPDVSPPKYRGVVHCAREIYAKEGGRAFFKGFTPCILRAFPANAAAFTAFEIIMSVLPQ